MNWYEKARAQIDAAIKSFEKEWAGHAKVGSSATSFPEYRALKRESERLERWRECCEGNTSKGRRSEAANVGI